MWNCFRFNEIGLNTVRNDLREKAIFSIDICRRSMVEAGVLKKDEFKRIKDQT